MVFGDYKLVVGRLGGCEWFSCDFSVVARFVSTFAHFVKF